jgi:hypothetical protein
MPNPATVSDIEARWRPLGGTEVVKVDALLDDAWALLRQRVADIETRTGDTLDADLVVLVVTSIVLRVLKNPDGIRQESIQDYSVTWAAAGGLYVTDDELALLADPATVGDAFTIRPYSNATSPAYDPWIDL